MILEFTAPEDTPPAVSTVDRVNTMFLAGTIDNGNSEDWQETAIKLLKRKKELPFCDQLHVYNPRRKNWNPDASEEELVNQINWEMDKMRESDYILFNFLPDSKSPITMLELGYMSENTQCFVCCPKKFYRYTNIKVFCERIGIPVFDTLEELIDFL